MRCYCIVVLPCFVQFVNVLAWVPPFFWRHRSSLPATKKPTTRNYDDGDDCEYDREYEYDLVIIGAGASGMFASGGASMFGSKILLIDRDMNNGTVSNIGGDCTNSACVPSKAIRSISRMVDNIHNGDDVAHSGRDIFQLAKSHANRTVFSVRSREDPTSMVERSSKMDLMLVKDCYFVSSHEMVLYPTQSYSSNNELPNRATTATDTSKGTTTTPEKRCLVRSKKFLIATGANPIIPEKLNSAAKSAGLRTYTYRTLLHPMGDTMDDACDGGSSTIWNLLEETVDDDVKRIVIAGGGATACELGQSLARLRGKMTDNVEVHLVAPSLLSGEDVSLQEAAVQLLRHDGVVIHPERRVVDVMPDRRIMMSDGTMLPPADILVLCLGRMPSLSSLRLHNAGIDWDEALGVLVKPNLQSKSASHVFACGDCCSEVASRARSRTATHAAWTGYHATMSMNLPRFLTIGSKPVHNNCPRVVYTDPELVCVGLTLAECIEKYGTKGFDRLYQREENTDRADMDSLERLTIGFVELRSRKIDGKILGYTGCGPTASELANEMSLAIENGLTVLDVAKSIHSYPSHGYLLHRVALALALSNVWGLIEATGYPGRYVAKFGRMISGSVKSIRNLGGRRRRKISHAWEAEGSRNSIYFLNEAEEEKVVLPSSLSDGKSSSWLRSSRFVISFLDAANDIETRNELRKTKQNETTASSSTTAATIDKFTEWYSRKNVQV